METEGVIPRSHPVQVKSLLFFPSDNVEDLPKYSCFPAVGMSRYLTKIPQGGTSTETLFFFVFFNVDSSTAGPLCSWPTGLQYQQM